MADSPTDFTIKQGDTLEAITRILTMGDGTTSPRSLVGAAVRFHMKDSAGAILINKPATILDPTLKRVGYSWVAGDTSEASQGNPHQAEFEVTYSDGNVETFPNNGNINIHVIPQVA